MSSQLWTQIAPFVFTLVPTLIIGFLIIMKAEMPAEKKVWRLFETLYVVTVIVGFVGFLTGLYSLSMFNYITFGGAIFLIIGAWKPIKSNNENEGKKDVKVDSKSTEPKK